MSKFTDPQVSIYNGRIRELPSGADLLPHLIFAGSYWETLEYLKQFPSRDSRGEVIVYMYPPQFLDQEVTQ